MLAIDAIQNVCIAIAASDAITIKHIMTIATTIYIILVVIVESNSAGLIKQAVVIVECLLELGFIGFVSATICP